MKLKEIFEWSSQNNKNSQTISLFRNLFYGWMLLYYNTLAFKIDFFFGLNSFIPKSTTSLLFGNSYFNLFDYRLFEKYPILIVLFLDIIIILGYRFKKNRIFPLLIYFLVLTLDARSYYILDGGNNLIELIAIYNIFFSLEKDNKGPLGSLSSTLSNLALFMARIQVCIVYFVAGHSKMNGNYWTNGTALYYTLSVSEVSLGFVRDALKTLNPILIVLSAYSILAFQLSFPWLVWFKKTRKYVISIGLIFHLGISFIMGLTFFGYALCISYFLFYDEEESIKFIQKTKSSLNFTRRLMISRAARA